VKCNQAYSPGFDKTPKQIIGKTDFTVFAETTVESYKVLE
jgi:hypothetical protein